MKDNKIYFDSEKYLFNIKRLPKLEFINVLKYSIFFIGDYFFLVKHILGLYIEVYNILIQINITFYFGKQKIYYDYN